VRVGWVSAMEPSGSCTLPLSEDILRRTPLLDCVSH
jgi:hypothetical protein